MNHNNPIILVLYLVMVSFCLTSCVHHRQTEVKDSSTANSVKDLSDGVFLRSEDDIGTGKKIIGEDDVIKDTTINGCRIKYEIRDNDQFAGNENDHYTFRCREVLLQIHKEGINKEYQISRDTFDRWLKDNKPKYSVSSFDYKGMSDSGTLHFEVLLCIPDTDIEGQFDLSINNDEVTITEIPIYYDDNDLKEIPLFNISSLEKCFEDFITHIDSIPKQRNTPTALNVSIGLTPDQGTLVTFTAYHCPEFPVDIVDDVAEYTLGSFWINGIIVITQTINLDGIKALVNMKRFELKEEEFDYLKLYGGQDYRENNLIGRKLYHLIDGTVIEGDLNQPLDS